MDKLAAILTAVAVLALAAIVLAWPTQWLWNNTLVGAVDGINTIGLWQALEINILCSVLFRRYSIPDSK